MNLSIGIVLSFFLFPFLHSEKETVIIHSSITHENLERTYTVYIPASVSSRNAPLIIALHGSGNSSQDMMNRSEFHLLAEEKGFIVVFPNAYKHIWNDGRKYDQSPSHRNKVDDVGFLMKLTDLMIEDYSVDASRVYIAGFSNGGMMAHRMAVEHSDKFAAFAAVASAMPLEVSQGSPQDPLSMLAINGTADGIVVWEGGWLHTKTTDRGRVLSVENTVAYWVSHDACEQPGLIKMENRNLTDKTSLVITRYKDCNDSSEVVFYRVKGGGHTWPGEQYASSNASAGKISREIHASRVIWEFFHDKERDVTSL